MFDIYIPVYLARLSKTHVGKQMRPKEINLQLEFYIIWWN